MNKLTFAVLAGAIAAIGGCQRTGNPPPDVLNPHPIPMDSAIARRNWQESDAIYARSGVMTDPTLETWRASDNAGYTYQYLEVPLFLANIVASPFAAIRQHPWE